MSELKTGSSIANGTSSESKGPPMLLNRVCSLERFSTTADHTDLVCLQAKSFHPAQAFPLVGEYAFVKADSSKTLWQAIQKRGTSVFIRRLDSSAEKWVRANELLQLSAEDNLKLEQESKRKKSVTAEHVAPAWSIREWFGGEFEGDSDAPEDKFLKIARTAKSVRQKLDVMFR